MTKLLNKCHIAYNQSYACKAEFYRLIYKSTGLLSQAFKQGILADFINTHLWKS